MKKTIEFRKKPNGIQIYGNVKHEVLVRTLEWTPQQVFQVSVITLLSEVVKRFNSIDFCHMQKKCNNNIQYIIVYHSYNK